MKIGIADKLFREKDPTHFCRARQKELYDEVKGAIMYCLDCNQTVSTIDIVNKALQTQWPKRRDSQRDSDQNRARTEDVLAITVRQEFLFQRKVGRNSTENKAILGQTLSVSTLHCNQNCAFSRIAPTLTSPISLNFAQN